MPRPCVFLDRDDTLIPNRALTASTRGYLFDPELVRLLPGVADACLALSRAGFALVVVTNQAGIAEGLCTHEQVEATNDRLRRLLRASGVDLDGIYYSPHHPNAADPRYRADHAWRKPGPGMILAARDDLDLDLDRSWIVGDTERDLSAGLAAGLPRERCLLLAPSLDWRSCHDLEDAARVILAPFP